MLKGKIGVVIAEPTAAKAVEAIVQAEKLGIPAVWMTLGGGAPDSLTIFAAAAVQTQSILLGTGIVPTYPRHPIVMAQQAAVLASLAPGRFRLGIGTSHQHVIEGNYGLRMERPLTHLREYLTALKQAFTAGEMNFQGRFVQAHIRMQPVDVPVILSALRPPAFHLAGELADGAVSWVCPLPYLGQVALPALRQGAGQANRPPPPLYAHAPVCFSTDKGAIREAATEWLGRYIRAPFYARMFVDAGFPEAAEGHLSEALIDTLVVSGDAKQIADRLQQFIAAGMGEILVSILDIGPGSIDRTKRLMADLAG